MSLVHQDSTFITGSTRKRGKGETGDGEEQTVMWGKELLHPGFLPPACYQPLSLPHATVSPISQAPGFIKAPRLLPAVFCHILIISLWWSATRHTRALATRVPRHTSNCTLSNRTNAHAAAVGFRWSVKVRASFVRIIIEMSPMSHRHSHARATHTNTYMTKKGKSLLEANTAGKFSRCFHSCCVESFFDLNKNIKNLDMVRLVF